MSICEECEQRPAEPGTMVCRECRIENEAYHKYTYDNMMRENERHAAERAELRKKLGTKAQQLAREKRFVLIELSTHITIHDKKNGKKRPGFGYYDDLHPCPSFNTLKEAEAHRQKMYATADRENDEGDEGA